MLHHWLLITLSWVSSVSLQYIKPESPLNEFDFEALDGASQYPIPSANAAPTRTDFDSVQNDPLNEQFYQREDMPTELRSKRHSNTEQERVADREKRWVPNMVDVDKAEYFQNIDQPSPYVIGFSRTVDENDTVNEILDTVIQKRYFSPWGGKRNQASVGHMWTWKRENNIREPNMPKRVRFSPWGGKRSGQMLFKPGTKGSKLIFSTTIPEITKIIANYSPLGNLINITGFEFIPSLAKRRPIIFTASSNMNTKLARDALPFRSLYEVLPKFFKPGHPYAEVNLKKDGKRKVKFSAWGGKRSPPIIGPIWTPSQNNKESALKTIVLLGSKDQDKQNLDMAS